jgi:pimeloyl-ACP methyl ester carboxylesterase
MEALVSAGLDHFGIVGLSYGGFVAYQIAVMYPNAVDKLVIVSAGVCLEESDLSSGLFGVSDVAEAASLLVPQHPDDVRQLVKLTFYKPPHVMPTCFIQDYIQARV